MKWHRPKRTDVVEAVANAVIDALAKGIDDHKETVEAIRRDLNREAKRD